MEENIPVFIPYIDEDTKKHVNDALDMD